MFVKNYLKRRTVLLVCAFSICQLSSAASGPNALATLGSEPSSWRSFSSFKPSFPSISTNLGSWRDSIASSRFVTQFNELPIEARIGIGITGTLAGAFAAWKAFNGIRDYRDPVGAARRAVSNHDAGKLIKAFSRADEQTVGPMIEKCWHNDQLQHAWKRVASLDNYPGCEDDRLKILFPLSAQICRSEIDQDLYNEWVDSTKYNSIYAGNRNATSALKWVLSNRRDGSVECLKSYVAFLLKSGADLAFVFPDGKNGLMLMCELLRPESTVAAVGDGLDSVFDAVAQVQVRRGESLGAAKRAILKEHFAEFAKARWIGSPHITSRYIDLCTKSGLHFDTDWLREQDIHGMNNFRLRRWVEEKRDTSLERSELCVVEGEMSAIAFKDVIAAINAENFAQAKALIHAVREESGLAARCVSKRQWDRLEKQLALCELVKEHAWRLKAMDKGADYVRAFFDHIPRPSDSCYGPQDITEAVFGCFTPLRYAQKLKINMEQQKYQAFCAAQPSSSVASSSNASSSAVPSSSSVAARYTDLSFEELLAKAHTPEKLTNGELTDLVNAGREDRTPEGVRNIWKAFDAVGNNLDESRFPVLFSPFNQSAEIPEDLYSELTDKYAFDATRALEMVVIDNIERLKSSPDEEKAHYANILMPKYVEFLIGKGARPFQTFDRLKNESGVNVFTRMCASMSFEQVDTLLQVTVDGTEDKEAAIQRILQDQRTVIEDYACRTRVPRVLPRGKAWEVYNALGAKYISGFEPLDIQEYVVVAPEPFYVK